MISTSLSLAERIYTDEIPMNNYSLHVYCYLIFCNVPDILQLDLTLANIEL